VQTIRWVSAGVESSSRLIIQFCPGFLFPPNLLLGFLASLPAFIMCMARRLH